MKLTDAGVRLSPSDLANHVACRYLTQLDLEAALGQRDKPSADSDLLEMLRARGDEHEKAYVASLRAKGLKIVDLSEARALSADALARTRAAMADGVDAIVQAPLAASRWAGFADVLARVETPSNLGGWSYEAVDTKLARETRGGTILQLCVYSDLLGELQGRRPTQFHVVTPGDGRPFDQQSYRLDDFEAYYRLVRAQLTAAVPAAAAAPARLAAVAPGIDDTGVAGDDWPGERAGGEPPYPEPTAHCDICRWQTHCEARRRRDDHLSLVAGIRRSQRDELAHYGIRTLTALAQTPLPFPFRPRRGSVEALARVREQARVQLQGRTRRAPYYESLPVEPERGLLRLPAPSPGDIFLDIEGDPFAGTSGLEYLFGWATRDERGKWRCVSRWATDAASERAAFDAFMSEATAALERDPDLHIYHYAPYEPAALKRLMGTHATCEEALDRLLRGGVLVDLHAIARQTIVASVERYTIKQLEPFYGFTRSLPLRVAAHALRQVEYLLETGQPLPEGDELRRAVESYNRDDCLSAAALRDWLERLRSELIERGHDLPRPAPQDGTAAEQVSERDLRVRELAERLTADVPADAGARTPEQEARTLLAHMLAFHRREAKSAWWEFFRLADLDDEARLQEKGALAGLEFVGQLSATKRGVVVNRYRYPPQEFDADEKDELFTNATHKIGRLEAIDRDARTVDIRHLAATAAERPTSVVARRIYHADEQAESLFRIGEWVAQHGLHGPGPFLAARRLLARTPPVFADGIILPSG